MFRVVEQRTTPKSSAAANEDACVVTPCFAAVIDGATPKTAFRYPGGLTPGCVAAQRLTDAIGTLPPEVTAAEAARLLTAALHEPEVAAADRPIASCALYSSYRRQVWLLGDCQCAFLLPDSPLDAPLPLCTNRKAIDTLLADWRRAVLTSLLSRGILTPAQIAADDPGRRIIQPHITQQVRFQNLDRPHRLAYGMLDGEPFPERFIRILDVPAEAKALILATDGYPALYPTLAQTEAHLQRLLAQDPLCIGPLCGTKGLRPHQQSFDDRTYLRLEP